MGELWNKPDFFAALESDLLATSSESQPAQEPAPQYDDQRDEEEDDDDG